VAVGKLVPKHFNETVDTSRKQILRDVETYLLLVKNTSGNTLYISFDGTNYYSISAGSKETFRAFANKPIKLDRFYVKGGATGTSFEIVYLVEEE